MPCNKGSLLRTLLQVVAAALRKTGAYNLLEGYLQEVYKLLMLQDTSIYRVRLSHVTLHATAEHA